MKKIQILILLFCLAQIFGSQVLAQNNQEIKCEMSVEDILRQQPFDIDDAKSETAEQILKTLFHEIDFIYNHQNTSKEDLISHFDSIDSALMKAKHLNMNLVMLEDDLKAIKKLQ